MRLKKTLFDTCCLSGLPIINKSDWSREHYAPKSRIPPELAQNPYNIRPALKIINNIKGDLFPCEWQDVRLARCYKAIATYHLSHRHHQQILQAISIFESVQPTNSCQGCICALVPEYCPHKSILDRQH